MGGLWKLWQAMRSKNTCKTCALGMGGQKGGMVNELGSFPEVCKKSLQAMAADMQGAIKPEFWSTYSIAQLQAFSPRELESCGRLVQPGTVEAGNIVVDTPLAWSRFTFSRYQIWTIDGIPLNRLYFIPSVRNGEHVFLERRATKRRPDGPVYRTGMRPDEMSPSLERYARDVAPRLRARFGGAA